MPLDVPASAVAVLALRVCEQVRMAFDQKGEWSGPSSAARMPFRRSSAPCDMPAWKSTATRGVYHGAILNLGSRLASVKRRT